MTSWGPPPATFCHLHEGPKYSPGEGDRGQAEPPDSALPQHTQGSLESCSRKLCSDYLGLHLSPEQISVLLEVPEGGLALNMDQTLPGVPLEEPGAGTWELSQTLHAPHQSSKRTVSWQVSTMELFTYFAPHGVRCILKKAKKIEFVG